MAFFKKQKIKKLVRDGWDLNFAYRVQPKGNIDFRYDDRYWKSGDGLHAGLFVTTYPTGGLGDHWGTELMQIPNTVAFMHVETLDRRLVQEKATKSVEEKSSRISDNQKKTKQQMELDEVRDLMQFEQDVRMNNSAVKGIRTRIFVSANTESDLFSRMGDVKDAAPKFQMTSFIGEQDIEYKSPFVPGSKQILLPNKRQTQPIISRDLGGSYFFNHTMLDDAHGSYFGYTPTSGAVNFNLLQLDEIRTRPFMLISGNPRMYQKKFMLKNTDALYSKGHKIINIDLDGTFEDLTNYQYGKTIDVAAGTNRINIMQVLPSVTKANGVEVDEIGSFRLHVAKLKGFAQVLNQELNSNDLDNLERLISKFYVTLGYWYENAEANADKIHITTLYNNEHPRLSDFVTFLQGQTRQIADTGNEVDTLSYKRITSSFANLQSNYQSTFDTYTEFEDLSSEQVVTFNLSGLTGDQRILNLQLFQVLSLISSYVVNNGKVQRQIRRENRNIPLDHLTHYIVNISSAQRVFNMAYSQSVTYLANIMEAMGNNFGGIVLEMTSLQNLLVQNDEGLNEYANAVRRIFSLMQYRVFANTDETVVGQLAQTLSGSMTESELETLPTLQQGQLFMNIAGSRNIVFNQEFLGDEYERYENVD